MEKVINGLTVEIESPYEERRNEDRSMTYFDVVINLKDQVKKTTKVSILFTQPRVDYFFMENPNGNLEQLVDLKIDDLLRIKGRDLFKSANYFSLYKSNDENVMAPDLTLVLDYISEVKNNPSSDAAFTRLANK